MRNIELLFLRHQYIAIIFYVVLAILYALFVIYANTRKERRPATVLFIVMNSLLGAILLPFLFHFAFGVPGPSLAGEMEEIFGEANALVEDGDYNQAVVKLDSLIQMDPNNARWYAGLATAQYKAKDNDRYSAALEAIENALNKDPNNGSYMQLRGKILYNLNRLEDARDAFQDAIDAQGDDYNNYEWFGYINEKLGDYDAATAAYEAAINLNGSLAKDYLWLGRAYAWQGKYSQALETIRDARINGYDLRGYQELEDLINQMKIVDAHPDNSSEVNELGILLYNIKEYERALEMFKTAVQLNPSDASFRYNRGYTAYMLEDFSSAKEDLAIATQLNPDNEKYAIDYALISAKDTALNQAPHSSSARIAYSYALYRKGKLDDALEQMKIAEVCVRDDAEITGLRAAIDSLAVVNSSKELASEQERAEMMYSIGFLMYFQEDYEAAIREGAAAAALQADKASYHDLEACALWRLGRYNEACAEFESAITLTKNDDDAAEYREKLEHLQSMMG